MTTNQRISELDALRGIGVLLVVLFHYTYRYYEYSGSPIPAFNFRYGRLGVELFFMISGFVIFMTIERTRSAKTFLLLRLTRLFPGYWFAIIFTSVIVTVFGLPGLEVSWKAMLFNFTMTQELFDIPNVDPAYWSLFPELSFYLLIAMVLAVNKREYFDAVFLFWMGFIFVCPFLDIPLPFQELFNLRYGVFFIAGIQFYRWKKARETGTAFTLFQITLLLSVVFVWYSYNTVSALIITLFYGLFFLLVLNRLTFLKVRILLFIGAVSYPLYLVHTCLGFIVMNVLSLTLWSEFLIAFVLSLITATGMHYFIEKPAMDYLRRKWLKKPSQVTPN
ncbi:MAG: acyltransferase [Bacteroidetes bacterium]|nr:acyltransferase [Bacteroidota bacterium]